MKTLPLLLALAALPGLAAGPGAPARPVFVLAAASATSLDNGDSSGGAAKKDDLYLAAKRDLDAHRWAQAIDKLVQVARKGGADADGALYWKAYAEHKSGHGQVALATIRQLSGAYPKSAWLDDARALSAEIRGGSGSPSPGSAKGGDDEDEELKLYALNGLLASDPKSALPILQKFLQGNHSARLKEQALFVLSQSGAPEAHATLVATARGSAHPELQQKAIEYLGIAGGEANAKALDEIYRGSNRTEVKRSVLNAFLVAGQRGRVVAVARDDKDPLRTQAIELLGAMGAKAELRQILASAGSREERRAALNGMVAAGDADGLIEASRREQDPDLRVQAILSLGAGGGAKGAEALRSLYAGSPEPSIRRAVIDALFSQANARVLIEIFRGEKDREMRREIVQRLSLMQTKESSEFLDKIYSN